MINDISEEQLLANQSSLFEKSMCDYIWTATFNVLIFFLLVYGLYSPIHIFGMNISLVSFIILFFTVKDLLKKRIEYRFNKAMLLMFYE